MQGIGGTVRGSGGGVARSATARRGGRSAALDHDEIARAEVQPPRNLREQNRLEAARAVRIVGERAGVPVEQDAVVGILRQVVDRRVTKRAAPRPPAARTAPKPTTTWSGRM